MHRFDIRIYYEDTDSGGVVYHSKYLNFAERARTEMLRFLDISQEKLKFEEGGYFVVNKLNIEYKSFAVLDDLIAIRTRIKKLGFASLKLEQLIEKDDIKISQLAVEIVYTTKTKDGKFKPNRIPNELRKKFEKMLSNKEDLLWE